MLQTCSNEIIKLGTIIELISINKHSCRKLIINSTTGSLTTCFNKIKKYSKSIVQLIVRRTYNGSSKTPQIKIVKTHELLDLLFSETKQNNSILLS